MTTGELREIDRTDNGDVTGLTFAPDSRWLAWSRPGRAPLARRSGWPRSPSRQQRPSTSPHFASPTPSLRSALMATIWPSCRPAASTRSTTPTCSTSRSPMAAGRSWSRCRRRRRPRSIRMSPDGRRLRRRTRLRPSSGPPPCGSTPRASTSGSSLPRARRPVRLAAASRRRVSRLRAPLAGALGDDLARLDDDPPRSALERFGLTSRRTLTLLDAVDRFVPTGDGARLVVVDKHDVQSHPGRPQGQTRGGGEVRRPRRCRSRSTSRRRHARPTSGSRCSTRRDG